VGEAESERIRDVEVLAVSFLSHSDVNEAVITDVTDGVAVGDMHPRGDKNRTQVAIHLGVSLTILFAAYGHDMAAYPRIVRANIAFEHGIDRLAGVTSRNVNALMSMCLSKTQVGRSAGPVLTVGSHNQIMLAERLA